MSEQIKIKADKDKISEYIINFEKGLLQVPAFQRDFVWTNDKKLDLFDSIKKGYPIGSVLLWQPLFENEDFYGGFSGDKLGSYPIPKRSANSFFILDGFQRLSTLIGCLLHPQKAKQKGIVRDEKEWLKEFNIIYNLKEEQFEINRNSKEFYQIPIYKLVDGKEFFQFQKNLFDDDQINSIYIERYEEISLIFQNYELPNINVYGGSITEAIDIFQRLNSTGAPITADWVINARAMGKNINFRLGDKIDNLLLNELTSYNFQNIKRLVILQCITNSFGGVYFDQISKNNNKKLEVLVDKPEFIPVTEKTFLAIERAVKFLFEELIVLDAKYIPYNNQMIFVTDFFNKIELPTTKQIYELKKWFWITSYSNYFTIYNLSKQRIAYYKFQDFILNEDENPIFYDNSDKFETLEFPDKIEMGSVRKKTLALFMTNYSINKEEILKGKSLLVDNIENVKSYKLFKDFNSSENTVFVVEKYNSTDNFPKSIKDLSFMLLIENKGNFSEYFINEDMRVEYEKGNIDVVLEIRKELIIKAERAFVESLGIEYYE
ncbi:DUF262 domain-containing protein [Flavobacterium psychrophilum]|uniref:DUF262 domain-containing protein n=1 Tax=Flavobacterium psychrophilum TaxID=96345 RepID=UPI000A3A2370|nr:DUF262 domain-containing protein [Flavobacterium psychrophilum]ELM3643177.1 DUF262 domain-containing protein [Flavobacterium psychrophilum]OUD27958.1 hypothetical protein FPG92_05760 [Flavobacterium psychrophilum]SNB43481.1 conserved hypothetical protein [Flavobacterium psychrophilum]